MTALLPLTRSAVMVTDPPPAPTLIGKCSQAPLLNAFVSATVLVVDPSLTVSEKMIVYPTREPDWQLLEAMFTSQQPGAWFGPERRAKGWRFIELLGKVTKQQAFEELPQGIQQNISSAAAELVRDTRFKQFTDSLAAAFHPVVYRDRIAGLPWPVPPPLDVGR